MRPSIRPRVLGASAFTVLMAASPLAGAAPAPVQPTAPTPRESTADVQTSALGVLSAPAAASLARVRKTCLALPAIPENELVGAGHASHPSCQVVEFRALSGAGAGWAFARYQLGLPAVGTDSAERPTGPAAWEEVVLLELLNGGAARAVWHDRFVTDEDEVWRSVTPAVSRRHDGQVLVSIRYCLNGTGGCNQAFLVREPRGTWTAVKQSWLQELPPGFAGRIRHGVSIDPDTLRGEAGFYADGDPNCCPSQTLIVDLALRRSSLVLLRRAVVPSPKNGASGPAPACAT